MSLSLGESSRPFVPVPLVFTQHGRTDVFAVKNNKTVSETLAEPRYASLTIRVRSDFPDKLDLPLGSFLAGLKAAGDERYRLFLNRYGDLRYCAFTLEAFHPAIRQQGLYCFTVGDEVRYIGRTLTSFGTRIQQGYGVIHPKNCYLDGQATNCHLNALIQSEWENVRFHVCSLVDQAEIIQVEAELIRKHQPRWNIALKKV
ncbi:hypothetical protein [Deinococcus sp. UYEF24]